VRESLRTSKSEKQTCRPEQRGEKDLLILEQMLLKVNFMQDMSAEELSGISKVC
jgi:hypothetical protein